MKKIDRAVEIIRGYNAGSCVTIWDEEVEE